MSETAVVIQDNAIVKILDELKRRGKLSGADVANVANVSKATVSRWHSGKAAPHPKTQLVLSDLKYIVDRLSEFYTPEETRVWLTSRNDLLDGARAIELIHEDRADEVLQAIEGLGALTYL